MVGLPCVPAAGSSGGKAGDGDDEEQLLVPGAGQGLLSWREVLLDEFLASQALEKLLHTEDYLSIFPKSS